MKLSQILVEDTEIDIQDLILTRFVYGKLTYDDIAKNHIARAVPRTLQ